MGLPLDTKFLVCLNTIQKYVENKTILRPHLTHVSKSIRDYGIIHSKIRLSAHLPPSCNNEILNMVDDQFWSIGTELCNYYFFLCVSSGWNNNIRSVFIITVQHIFK